MRFHKVMRLDPPLRLYRLARIMWDVGTVGDGNGYSVKLSIGLTPRLFRWVSELGGWICTVAGVRLHCRRAYGGRFVD
jgi:hypothetical protein